MSELENFGLSFYIDRERRMVRVNISSGEMSITVVVPLDAFFRMLSEAVSR